VVRGVGPTPVGVRLCSERVQEGKVAVHSGVARGFTVTSGDTSTVGHELGRCGVNTLFCRLRLSNLRGAKGLSQNGLSRDWEGRVI